MRRSHSQGVATDVVLGSDASHVRRSAKKWGRSAHLHEVRGKGERVRGAPASPGLSGGERSRYSEERDLGDGTGGAPDSVDGGGESRPFPSSTSGAHDGGGGDVDVWVDTDVDGSEGGV
jgi:hypothetical protein